MARIPNIQILSSALLTRQRPDIFSIFDSESISANCGFVSAVHPLAVTISDVENMASATGFVSGFSPLPVYVPVIGLDSGNSENLLLDDGKEILLDSAVSEIGAATDFVSAIAPVKISISPPGESFAALAGFISAFAPIEIPIIKLENVAANASLISATH